MALIHNLCVGHFVPDGGFVRYENMRPACERPLDLRAVSDLLRQYLGNGKLDAIPPEWGMSVTSEYILCHRSNSRALRFVADFARREEALIVDLGCFTLVSPDEVTVEADLLDRFLRERAQQPQQETFKNNCDGNTGIHGIQAEPNAAADRPRD